MARLPRGIELLDFARKQLANASEVNELRILQAVVLPLCHGLSTKETAEAVGRSARWVTMVRNDYIRHFGEEKKQSAKIRNHANMPWQEEEAFLAPFFENAREGGVLVVNTLHQALEERLGRKVALSSAYNLLHRHGWRKLAPDKRNIAADAQAQNDWKKNSLKS
jgi:transposase